MMHHEELFDILGVGCATVDELLYVDAYPAADEKTIIRRHETHCGGLTAVALIAAARFGARCAYAGTLGVEPQSDFVIETLKREGVDTSHAPRCDDAAAIHSRIIVDATHNTRNIFFTVGQRMGPSETLSEAVIRSARVLFVDHYGGAATVRAATIARNAGIPVVADLERSEREAFDQILGLASHPILSAAFAKRLTGKSNPEDAARALIERGHDVVVVTNGAQGGAAAVRDEPDLRRYRAFDVEVVDTTGCGDVFHGVYAAGLALSIGLDERLARASAAAAIKATRPGASGGVPRRAEIDAFLAQRGAL